MHTPVGAQKLLAASVIVTFSPSTLGRRAT